jgi:RHS repeat-associated protein
VGRSGTGGGSGFCLAGLAQVAESATGRTTSFERNRSGRLTARVIEGGNPVDPRWSYAYDGLGRLTKMQDPTETPTNPNDANGTTLDRDGAGRVEHVLRDGEVVDSSGRDAAGRLAWVKRLDGEAEFKYGIAYDDVSRLTGAVDSLTVPPEQPIQLRSFGWTYNPAGERLTQTAGGVTESYAWNGVGVLTAVTGGGADRTFDFDLAGNLLALTTQGAGAMSFAYDKSGRTRQVTAPDGSVVSYRYGPDERRIRQSIDPDGAGPLAPEVVCYFSDGLVTYEVDGDTGDLRRAFVFLPDGFTPVMLVAFADNAVSAVFFYHNDHLSTPRAVTDETGDVVWRARYEPFGGAGDDPDPDLAAGDLGLDIDPDGDNVPLDQPLRFPGQWDDGVPGLWYNWHRFYLPKHGAYTRRDPYVVEGPEGKESPGFGYVEGNPANVADPTGLREWYDDFGDVLFGFTDMMSFGATSWARDALGCGDAPNEDSWAYFGGEIGAFVAPFAALRAGAVFMAGGKTTGSWGLKLFFDSRPHAFTWLGEMKHFQAVLYKAGVKGSHFIRRLPWPW